MTAYLRVTWITLSAPQTQRLAIELRVMYLIWTQTQHSLSCKLLPALHNCTNARQPNKNSAGSWQKLQHTCVANSSHTESKLYCLPALFSAVVGQEDVSKTETERCARFFVVVIPIVVPV